jgi:hypothetical protein
LCCLRSINHPQISNNPFLLTVKNFFLTLSMAVAFIAAPSFVNSALAGVCDSNDPLADAVDCAALGGTFGPGSPTPGGGSGGGPGGVGGPAGIPIDGGISALIAIGGGLGLRRFAAKKKQAQA